VTRKRAKLDLTPPAITWRGSTSFVILVGVCLFVALCARVVSFYYADILRLSLNVSDDGAFYVQVANFIF
jgi:hypothetical protein